MKYLIQWQAITPKGKVVNDATVVDNENRSVATRLFLKNFDYKKYKSVEISQIKLMK